MGWSCGARPEDGPALAVPSPTGHSPKVLVTGCIDTLQQSKWWIRARAQKGLQWGLKGDGGRDGAGVQCCCTITRMETEGPEGLQWGPEQGGVGCQRGWDGTLLFVHSGPWELYIGWLLKLCEIKKHHKFIISNNIYIPVPPTQTNRQ